MLLRLLVLLLIALGVHSQVRAEAPPRPALHWSRGPGASSCIDPHTLGLRVTALTGPVLVDATRADISIEGQVTRTASGVYEARITATGNDGVPRGTRTLRQSGDCRALDQALAFVIALLIDPDLVLEHLPAELVSLGAEGEASQDRLLRELQAEPPARPVVVASESPARPPTARTSGPAAQPAAPPPSALYQLHFGVETAVRELPRASAGLYLSALVLARRWLGLDVSLRGAFMPGSFDLGEGRSVQAQRFSVGVLACPRYPWSGLFVELCVGPEATLLRAQGRGFSNDDLAHRAAFAVQLALGFGALLRGAWSLRVRARTHLLLNEAGVTYRQPDGQRQAFRLERVAVGADFGVGYQF